MTVWICVVRFIPSMNREVGAHSRAAIPPPIETAFGSAVRADVRQHPKRTSAEATIASGPFRDTMRRVARRLR